MTHRVTRPLNQDEILTQSFRLGDLLPADHPARRLVALLADLDLSALVDQYATHGAPIYAPRQLLALLVYGYMNGLLSSRQLERATYEQIPCIYLMGGAHPDHSTLADFRRLVFTDGGTLFTQILQVAQRGGHFTLGPVSGDGTKIHADASKHAAVSYERAGQILDDLREQVSELRTLSLQRDQTTMPPGMDVMTELALRLERIDRLEEARRVLEARAAERYQHELAAYAANVAARTAREQATGKPPRGKPPAPPVPGPRAGDQYNFTDPPSRIMKNSTNTGVDQHYNAQLAVEQQHRLIVSCQVTAQPNDVHQALPLVEAIPAVFGHPPAVAFDAGYRSTENVCALEERGIIPYIATGKGTHGLNWRRWYAAHPTSPPPDDMAPLARMDYALTTAEGDAIYRQRKSTVEPVIGIIKEVLRFRQFSVRGIANVQGEWRLVCLAYNVKRLLTLMAAPRVEQAVQQAQIAINQAKQTASTAWHQCVSGANKQMKRRASISMSRCIIRSVCALDGRSSRPWPTGC